jgi:large subunit ribosomal protein L20
MLAARGYFGARSKVYTVAKNTLEKGWQYAYRDRKFKKRTYRRLWIARINAATRQ